MENNNNIYMRMVKGLGTSFIFTLLGILIFSIILTYSNVSESITPIVLIAISAISILIGATIPALTLGTITNLIFKKK